ncbi:MAG: hypothetical protein HY815_15640 [Candidatus Riflebacteria bacterium]|nr:hypothetical protein [Candidatus Riflebacteria bacterium]
MLVSTGTPLTMIEQKVAEDIGLVCSGEFERGFFALGGILKGHLASAKELQVLGRT